MYSSVYVFISIPFPLSFGNYKFIFYMCLFLFYK